MPLPAAVIPMLSSMGLNLGQDINNNSNEQRANRQSRKWSEKMYQRQYDDNINFWNTQNEYNTPEMQMQRLRNADLNPNLIYGNGAAGGQASPIKSPEVQKPNFNFTPGRALSEASQNPMQFALEMETRQLTNDNLRADNDIKIQDAQLRKAQILGTLTAEEKNRYFLEFEKGLSGISAETRSEKLRQLKTGTDISINKDARESVALSNSIQESVQRMSESRQRVAQSKEEVERIKASTKLLSNDARLRQLEIELRQDGLNPNDPSWQIMVAKFIQYYAEGKLGKPKGGSILKWLMSN